MSKQYYDSALTGAEIDKALKAVSDLVTQNNNGKILTIENGKFAAKKPSEIAGTAVLETLNVSANGDYYPESGIDGYDEVHVSVPSYPEPTGTIQISSNGTVNVKDYASAEVSVPSGITAADEGKVVKNGTLVAQTARATEITANGQYDTTENNSVTVNVSGGGGGSGPVYSGASTPSASIGAEEDLYIQYEAVSGADHTYRIVAEYRKVNGVWTEYTIPELPTKGVHIWTQSTGGSDAAMYVQDGYWDADRNLFVTTVEAEIVVYAGVNSWSKAKNCNGVALLAYTGNWQIKASTTVTDGTNTYQADAIVAQWDYYVNKDIYIYKPLSS